MSKKTDTNNDPFDEFEFKPLTAGLGFHKTANPSPVSDKVDFKGSHLNFDLKSPLPRATTNQPQATSYTTTPRIAVPTIEDDSITKAQSAVNEILKSLNQKKQHEDALKRNTKRPEWTASVPSISAGSLDAMLIAAFFLLSLIAMLAITKIDLIANLSQPDPQYLIYWATASLLGAVQIIYYVICRAFLGCTPGEWAFDQRCGNELQLASSTYVLRVVLRSIITAATGFITMTLISLIVRFDVLAAVTGVQIQRLK